MTLGPVEVVRPRLRGRCVHVGPLPLSLDTEPVVTDGSVATVDGEGLTTGTEDDVGVSDGPAPVGVVLDTRTTLPTPVSAVATGTRGDPRLARQPQALQPLVLSHALPNGPLVQAEEVPAVHGSDESDTELEPPRLARLVRL